MQLSQEKANPTDEELLHRLNDTLIDRVLDMHEEAGRHEEAGSEEAAMAHAAAQMHITNSNKVKAIEDKKVAAARKAQAGRELEVRRNGSTDPLADMSGAEAAQLVESLHSQKAF